jgi:hypothetical protein
MAWFTIVTTFVHGTTLCLEPGVVREIKERQDDTRKENEG